MQGDSNLNCCNSRVIILKAHHGYPLCGIYMHITNISCKMIIIVNVNEHLTLWHNVIGKVFATAVIAAGRLEEGVEGGR